MDRFAHITKFMTKPVASAPTISLKLRRLETGDLAIYRDLRLQGLKSHSTSLRVFMGARGGKPLSWWAERLEANTVFGGWVNSSRLAGVTGLRLQDAVKLQHKGVVWMYVRPETRGTGLAAALVQQVVERADSGRRSSFDGGDFKRCGSSPFTARPDSRNTGLCIGR
jgi:GNAT superfamily N-acetyltransferase